MLEESIDKVQENVLGVFRVALDAHDVISKPEHLDTSVLRPSHHLYMGR